MSVRDLPVALQAGYNTAMQCNLFQLLDRRFGPRDNGMTRREMLKASAAVGAGLLLSNSLARSAMRAAGKRVIVIGGGFGGVSAAYQLHQAGYEGTVVEAR